MNRNKIIIILKNEKKFFKVPVISIGFAFDRKTGNKRENQTTDVDPWRHSDYRLNSYKKSKAPKNFKYYTTTYINL